jgi:predicted DNA-binding transcriptional regulator YafY
MQRLLESLEPGLLGPHVAPLLGRLKSAIGSGDHPAAEVHKRIRILHLAKRTLPPQHFQIAAAAVLQRRRLRITYYSRARDEQTRRDISPQRSCTIARTGTWTHGAICVRIFAALPVDAIRDAPCSMTRRWS